MQQQGLCAHAVSHKTTALPCGRMREAITHGLEYSQLLLGLLQCHCNSEKSMIRYMAVASPDSTAFVCSSIRASDSRLKPGNYGVWIRVYRLHRCTLFHVLILYYRIMIIIPLLYNSQCASPCGGRRTAPCGHWGAGRGQRAGTWG